jgi:hypothetical protein
MKERRYPIRDRWPREFPNHVVYYTVGKENIYDPVTVSDALSRHDKDKWLAAMDDEYKSLMKNNAWMLVDKPHNANIVRCEDSFPKWGIT